MAVKKGDVVPEFELPTSEGKKIFLPDFKGKSVVLYFYPKDQTSGCTAEACSFRDHKDAFDALDAEIVGVSPDSKASHEKFKQDYDLPFTLVVDESHRLAEAFGVWKEKEKDGKVYHGNERATFVIDKEGHVANVYHDVNVDGHVEEALQYIKENMS